MMRIAITSQGKDLHSPVDQRFGRAKRFVVADTVSEVIESINNTQNLHALQGAGVQAAEYVCRLGVECVITGHCGPKAFRALSAAGIKVYVGAEGTVGEAIEAFRRGELRQADQPDVEGHWA